MRVLKGRHMKGLLCRGVGMLTPNGASKAGQATFIATALAQRTSHMMAARGHIIAGGLKGIDRTGREAGPRGAGIAGARPRIELRQLQMFGECGSKCGPSISRS